LSLQLEGNFSVLSIRHVTKSESKSRKGAGQVVYPKSEAKPSNDMGHLKLNNLLIYGGLLEIYNTYGYASFLISVA
jgi:hypothetical protein